MSRVPEHLWHFPPIEVTASLAKRFDLPFAPYMQDWTIEFSDSQRIDEFLEAYESAELTDDECFVLMELILASFDDMDSPLNRDARWHKVLEHIDKNVETHIYSLWYWSDLRSDFHIAPYIHPLFERHYERFAQPRATEKN